LGVKREHPDEVYRVAARFFEERWTKAAASLGTSFAGDKEAVYIASQVVQTGKCHRTFAEAHKARLVEAALARYNIGVVSMETGAWGWVYEGSTFFQDPKK
jgi:hypothetical protein